MMPAWVTIALKDLRLLGRDRIALFWVLGFPLVFAGFFGSIMAAGLESDTAPIPVVVVGTNDNPRAKTLADGLSDSGVAVARLDRERGQERVRVGQAVALIEVGRESGTPISLGIDPSRRSEAAMLEGLILRSLAGEFINIARPPPAIQASSVLDTPRGPRSGFELIFPAMLLWGLLGCAATFAVGLVTERSSGTLQRLWAAPISRASVLAGKGAACLTASLTASALLSAICLGLLDIHVDQPAKLAAGIGATALCFSGLTMVLSVLGRTEQAVAGAGWSTLIVLAMLGGAMVPLSLMPSWLLSVSDLSPVKWGIRALEGAIWRGDDWRDLTMPLLALLALGIVTFATGTGILAARES